MGPHHQHKYEVDMSKGAKRERWAKQLLLNLSYGSIALNACVRGPTLLDLEDVYHTDTATIAYSFLFGSSCAVLGSVTIGQLMHKFPRYHFTIMFFNMLLCGFANALLPHCGFIWLFFLASAAIGFVIGASHTGLNVLCMDIWRGQNPAPYMHGMFFFFSLGALSASVLAKPFLSTSILDHGPAGTDGCNRVHDPVGSNETQLWSNATLGGEEAFEGAESDIGTLYPITALVVWFISLGHMYLGSREIMAGCRHRFLSRSDSTDDTEEESPAEKEPFFGNNVAVKNKVALTVLMMIYFSVYMCAEFAILSFLPAFAVKCDLCLSKIEGANLLAVFLIPFALKRLVAIFLAMKLKPMHFLVINFTLQIAGNAVLVILGESDKTILFVAYAVVGLGMGSMYANGLVWVEQFIPVKGRVTATLNSCGAVGVMLSPLVLGNLIDVEPMALPYVQAAITGITIVLFAIGGVFGKKILVAEARDHALAEERKEEQVKLNTENA